MRSETCLFACIFPVILFSWGSQMEVRVETPKTNRKNVSARAERLDVARQVKIQFFDLLVFSHLVCHLHSNRCLGCFSNITQMCIKNGFSPKSLKWQISNSTQMQNANKHFTNVTRLPKTESTWMCWYVKRLDVVHISCVWISTLFHFNSLSFPHGRISSMHCLRACGCAVAVSGQEWTWLLSSTRVSTQQGSSSLKSLFPNAHSPHQTTNRKHCLFPHPCRLSQYIIPILLIPQAKKAQHEGTFHKRNILHHNHKATNRRHIHHRCGEGFGSYPSWFECCVVRSPSPIESCREYWELSCGHSIHSLLSCDEPSSPMKFSFVFLFGCVARLAYVFHRKS